MAHKVTIQDIADALGLSRNTVSKAINNTGVLADATKERVLQKAMEMGYKAFSYTAIQDGMRAAFPNLAASSSETDDSPKTIALLSGLMLDTSHFASTMMDKFQYELSLLGYNMTIHRIMQDDFEQLKLPLSFHKKSTAAIICVEVFNHSYCQMLCSLGLPILFVDAPVSTYASPLNADILLMENASGIYQIVKTARQKGITKIGFVGEALHCRSFYERYMAYRDAMYLYSLPVHDAYCLTQIHPRGKDYRDFLREKLKAMDDFPELFICANDFIAVDMLIIMRELNISCPKDIMLCGFDDSPESRVTTPSLTTCHIHSQIMGLSAANMLINRIMEPDLNYRIVHTETELLFRESTRGEFNDA